jgi:CheY-like chemotaxis protein
MQNKNVLVVDDELHLIRYGEDALRKIAENKPFLIFLDIMMPKKNGYEVCETIKKNPELKDIYIIMLSAKGWETDREKALSLGADDFMSKPFSPLDIISRVRKTMGNQSPVGSL